MVNKLQTISDELEELSLYLPEYLENNNNEPLLADDGSLTACEEGYVRMGSYILRP